VRTHGPSEMVCTADRLYALIPVSDDSAAASSPASFWRSRSLIRPVGGAPWMGKRSVTLQSPKFDGGRLEPLSLVADREQGGGSVGPASEWSRRKALGAASGRWTNPVAHSAMHGGHHPQESGAALGGVRGTAAEHQRLEDSQPDAGFDLSEEIGSAFCEKAGQLLLSGERSPGDDESAPGPYFCKGSGDSRGPAVDSSNPLWREVVGGALGEGDIGELADGSLFTSSEASLQNDRGALHQSAMTESLHVKVGPSSMMIPELVNEWRLDRRRACRRSSGTAPRFSQQRPTTGSGYPSKLAHPCRLSGLKTSRAAACKRSEIARCPVSGTSSRPRLPAQIARSVGCQGERRNSLVIERSIKCFLGTILSGLVKDIRSRDIGSWAVESGTEFSARPPCHQCSAEYQICAKEPPWVSSLVVSLTSSLPIVGRSATVRRTGMLGTRGTGPPTAPRASPSVSEKSHPVGVSSWRRCSAWGLSSLACTSVPGEPFPMILPTPIGSGTGAELTAGRTYAEPGSRVCRREGSSGISWTEMWACLGDLREVVPGDTTVAVGQVAGGSWCPCPLGGQLSPRYQSAQQHPGLHLWGQHASVWPNTKPSVLYGACDGPQSMT